MKTPEFDGLPMTKREVMIAREAFVRGIDHADTLPARLDDMRARDMLYPLPKVTRARVVADPQGSGKWTVIAREGFGPTVHFIGSSGHPKFTEWPVCASADRVALWADLLANPTEEVEA